jgi:hypothetical protein
MSLAPNVGVGGVFMNVLFILLVPEQRTHLMN